MATPPNRVISEEITGNFRFDVGFLKSPILYVELKQKVKRYSPHCDVIEITSWQRATLSQAFEIQFRYNKNDSGRQ